MTITKRGNSWLVSVGSGKDRFKRSYPTEDIAKAAEAAEIARRAQEKIGVAQSFTKNGKPAREASGYTLKDAYLAACKTKWIDGGGKPRDNALMILKELGEDTDLAFITPLTLEALTDSLTEKGNSGATINRKLSSLNVMLSIAEQKEWIDRAPKMPRRRESKYANRFFDNDTEEQMLTMCDLLGLDALADYIEMCIDTGFRKMELLNLMVADCFNGRAYLHAGTTKSKEPRSVPLTERCLVIVSKRKALGYRRVFQELTVSKLEKQWETLRDALGRNDDPHFIIHTMRHTCASRLAMKGESAQTIMSYLGHSSIMVTQRYMYLSPLSLNSCASALEAYRKDGAKDVGSKTESAKLEVDSQ